ncbi:MAG: glycosyltransferase [Bacteroidales bacterium]|nr:glycosyltransferase [Bacteroidales bacterium]
MKILFVIETIDNHNGTSVSAKRYASELRSRGHEVKFLTTGTPDANCFTVPEHHFPLVDGLVQRHGFKYAEPKEEVIREALEWCDVAHCLMPFGLEKATRRIADQMGKPCTAAFHVQPENVTATFHMQNIKWLNTIIYNGYNQFFFRFFRHIHCPSRFIADYLVHLGYTGEMHVISNGCPPKYHWHKCDKPAWCADKFVVLMVGRLSPEKHQDTILKAIRHSAYESQIQVILVGTGLSERKLRKKGKKLSNPPRIGYMSDEEVMDALGYADLYVHSGEVELESLSCLEAMSSGLVPLISCSTQSATSQFALDCRSLFAPRKPRLLAQKIDFWIEHPEIRKEMERKYAEFAKQYSIAESVSHFEAMLLEEISENETTNHNNKS